MAKTGRDRSFGYSQLRWSQQGAVDDRHEGRPTRSRGSRSEAEGRLVQVQWPYRVFQVDSTAVIEAVNFASQRQRSVVYDLARVDAIVDLAAEACRHCARRLRARHTLGEPRRHQVTELPPIAAHITEYRCHRRQCPDCGTITLAPLPDDDANQFGPR